MRVRWAAGRCVLAGMIALELAVTVATTWTALMARNRVLTAVQIPVASTVLVLGSRVSDGIPGDYVRGRLDTATELYHGGRVSQIINSGNGSPSAGDEPAVMRSYLVAHGVPDELIVDDPAGLDTAASCRRLREVFGVREVVVVTQDFHLDRAIALCRATGVDAVGVVARCECSTLSVVRNHFRETFLGRPRAVLSAMWLRAGMVSRISGAG
ncbi:MAG: ElyC/SanA/YdcF family protein [Gordonia sp. (in: high G+C Gram-positive bacteria)]